MYPQSLKRHYLASALLLHSAAVLSAAGIDGFTEPYREIEVAASEMGTVSKVVAKEGDVVTAGQLLASLDADVLLASLEMAQEAMAAEGKLKSAAAELRMQQDRLGKLKGLRARRHASQIEVDRSASQLEIAQARFQAVKEELRLKKIEYRRIKAQLDRRRIRSPIDGIVTMVKKDAGEFVSPSDPVVAKVVQLNPLLVVFSVPKEDARTLKKNLRVPVKFAINGVVDGFVEFVSPVADAQSGTTRVKVRIPNTKLLLQSGDACSLAMFDEPSETLSTKPVSISRN